jgi:hypothetical protein
MLPRRTKIIVASIAVEGRIAGVCQEDCFLEAATCFRLSMNRVEICFNAWFFLLNVAIKVNNVSRLIILKVASQS